ncbi:MAG: RNA ligase family protein [Verrucomicrobiota bacterium]
MKALKKYPRTPHLPWSPGGTKDDAYLVDTDHFEGHDVVVTEKMDGENTSMYHDHYHARSLDSQHHTSRDWVKALHARICFEIPKGWRICGENLFAQHSIIYNALPSYFMLFSVWTDDNISLSWSEVEEWAYLLELETAPVLYRGAWNQAVIKDLVIDEKTQEGYVVRRAEAFHYDEFPYSIGKWVRPGHVTTDQHWMHAQIQPNRLARPTEK